VVESHAGREAHITGKGRRITEQCREEVTDRAVDALQAEIESVTGVVFARGGF